MNNQTDAYKALAAAVIVGAIRDLDYIGNGADRVRWSAKEFLIGERCKGIRNMWLSWLDIDEKELRRVFLDHEAKTSKKGRRS